MKANSPMDVTGWPPSQKIALKGRRFGLEVKIVVSTVFIQNEKG
jgi:hypothetical protein